MVYGHGFRNVGGFSGEYWDRSGVDRCSPDGDDALRRQLLSELSEWSVEETVADDRDLGGVQVSLEGELYVVAGKGFCFEEGFSLLSVFCLEKDVYLACVGCDVYVCRACYVFTV